MNYSVLENVDQIKDLGVTIDNELSFDLHISEKVNNLTPGLDRSGLNLSFKLNGTEERSKGTYAEIRRRRRSTSDKNVTTLKERNIEYNSHKAT